MITLLNYQGKKVKFDVDLESDDVDFAMIRVLSGDELLDVTWRNGREATYDSDTKRSRIHGFIDGGYVIVMDGEWQVDRDKFFSRKTSYDMEKWGYY